MISFPRSLHSESISQTIKFFFEQAKETLRAVSWQSPQYRCFTVQKKILGNNSAVGYLDYQKKIRLKNFLKKFRSSSLLSCYDQMFLWRHSRFIVRRLNGREIDNSFRVLGSALKFDYAKKNCGEIAKTARNLCRKSKPFIPIFQL